MTKRVLIADDERSLRLLVTATLEGDGIALMEAVDGDEALRIARTERPDLILLDVQMPGLSGFEVCRAIKSDPELAGILVVMLTAQHGAVSQERGQHAGADHFLTKPFSPLQLLRLVEELLEPG